MTPITLDFVCELYQKYQDSLHLVRDEQRELAARGMRAQLDDIEAEITYLLLRERHPTHVVEVGAYHGWSTTWILRALRDNGVGKLHSFDIVDHVRHAVPEPLAADRWAFHRRDMRAALGLVPTDAGYLFIDAAHTARFARWYLAALMPVVPAGTPVSVHDVFHHRWAKPFGEGAQVLRWLAGHRVPYFTVSRAHARAAYGRITTVKRDLGLDTPVRHRAYRNPMIFFTLPRT